MLPNYWLPTHSQFHFFNLRAIASNLLWCKNEGTYTKEQFLETFPQFAKPASKYLSTFGRDPSNVGGPNVSVAISGNTAYVSGEIEWYPADEAVGRPAGHRVGFQVVAPEALENPDNAVLSVDGGETIRLKDDPNVSGNPRVFWWYPLVVETTTEHTLTINWSGLGPSPTETFTIHYEDFVLGPESESNTMPLSTNAVVYANDVGLDSVIPDAVLDMFIAMANAAVQKCRWFEYWPLATGLYIAHFATLYLQTYLPASEDNTPGSAAGVGGITGIVSSAQLGDAQISYDVSSIASATETWGAWNSTQYGLQLVTLARIVGIGGSYII